MEIFLFYQIPGTIQVWDFSPIGLHRSVYGDSTFLGLKKSWDLIRVDFSGVFLYSFYVSRERTKFGFGRDIYNMDETGLFFKALPEKSLLHKPRIAMVVRKRKIE